MPSVEEATAAGHVFITPSQLSIMLRVSKRTLCRWRSAGRLPPPVRLAGAVRWRLDDVTRWIDGDCLQK